jgi:NIMA (never in mitosis gene a)-related kinase 1/4/5
MSLDNFEVIGKLSPHVYRVRRIQDSKIYALKKVVIDHLSQKQIQNAINEVRFLASIRHPNVVSYKEAFYDPNSRSIWY